MVAINLLPWREKLVSQQKKIMRTIILAALLLAVLIIMVMHLVLTKTNQDLLSLVNQLEISVNKNVSSKTESGKNTDTLPSNTNLKKAANGLITDKIFAGFEHQQTVCFTEISGNSDYILFSGQTNAAIDLTEFLTNWKAMKWFSEIRIEKIQQTNERLLQFRFRGVIQG